MGSGGSSGHQSHTVQPGGGGDPALGAPTFSDLTAGRAQLDWDPAGNRLTIVRGDPLQRWGIEPPLTESDAQQFLNHRGEPDAPNMLTGRQLIPLSHTQLPEGLTRAAQRRAASTEAAAGAAESAAAQQSRLDAMRHWPVSEVSYLTDPQAYEDAYHAAQERARTGEPVVPYMSQNACAGLANPDGGRGFGVELEFDLPGMPAAQRQHVVQRIAEEMRQAGVSSTNRVHGYHEGRGRGQTNYTADENGWRVEHDATVAGEIVSPILYDTPQTWRNLKTVCDIINRNGGRASINTGSHVHVSTPDYDHNVRNYNTLLANAQSYEDTMYRLSANPERRNHRGTTWCRPNPPITPQGWSDQVSAVQHNGGHACAINMSGMRTGGPRDHAEFRMYDGSLDPGTIQAQINISLGMTHAAIRGVTATDPPHNQPRHEAHGTHRAIYGRRAPTDRQQWRQSSTSARSLADLIFWRTQNKDQLAAVMATTSWQGQRQRIT